jgi:hypothetical protein
LAVVGFGQQDVEILLQVVEIDILLQLADAGLGGFAEFVLDFGVGLEHGAEVGDVALQRTEVGFDEADRIVDLVRHAGRQLADGGHFFGLDQLALRFFEAGDQRRLLFALGLQIAVGRLQFGGALLDAPLEFVAGFAQGVFGGNPAGHVGKAENAADDVFAEVLRPRLAFEDPAIGQVEMLVARLAVHNGAQPFAAGRLLLDEARDMVDDGVVLVLFEQFIGNRPHRREHAVHADDTAMPVDGQDAVAGGFERRPQAGQRLLELLFGLAFLADVAGLDEEIGFVLMANQRDRFRHLDEFAVGPAVQPFLPFDFGEGAGGDLFPVKNVRQRTFDIDDLVRQQFVHRVTEHLSGLTIGPDDLQAVGIDEQDHAGAVIEHFLLERDHFLVPSCPWLASK